MTPVLGDPCNVTAFLNFLMISIFTATPMTLSSMFTVECRPEEIAATTPKLERCITDMDSWMSANRLKLNMDKTELLWAGTRYNMSMLNDSSPALQLNNVTVNASQHVRVLGVHLSSDPSLDKHVSKFQCQRNLLLSSSTQTYPAVA